MNHVHNDVNVLYRRAVSCCILKNVDEMKSPKSDPLKKVDHLSPITNYLELASGTQYAMG
jgi:hypothetical protein